MNRVFTYYAQDLILLFESELQVPVLWFYSDGATAGEWRTEQEENSDV
jgi:hypothetical protein